jgi:molybdenum cofactor biosynthesis enzyme MoaA
MLKLGLRIITNLHCNYKCQFCYQKDKSCKILNISTLVNELKKYKNKEFEYCTIMGGESTLLDNLQDYISWADYYCKQIRLTTNGALLIDKKLYLYKLGGLNGVNISIPSFLFYKQLTGSTYNIGYILDKIELAESIVGGTRVNIPLCGINIDGELERMLGFLLDKRRYNVTICEDLHGTHSLIKGKTIDKTANALNSIFDGDSGYGLLYFRRKNSGVRFGYYTHKDNYKETDLIISPVGIFNKWDDYCEKVGFTV